MPIRLRPTHTSCCVYAIYPVATHNGPCHIGVREKQESDMASIEYRDGIWFLTIPSVEAPMGFFTREAAVSFATNNLRLAVR